MPRLVVISFLLMGALSARPKVLRMEATAHSVEGITAAGTWSRPGTVAADPAVLPLGSRIRVVGAGRESGDYSVEDTGNKVDGRHIDIYMPTTAAAKKFGKQHVKVIVLEYGKPAKNTQAAKVNAAALR